MSNELIQYTEYLLEVRARVCALCQDSNDDGNCTISRKEACTIERHLPKIIEVSKLVNSMRMEDYIQVFREEICRDCRTDGETDCSLRDSEVCGLDKYYPLVLESLEAVEQRHRQ